MANEVDFLKNRIRDDQKKVEELAIKEQTDEVAARLRTFYQSLLDQNFTEEQAFWIVGQMVQKAFDNS